MNQNWWEYYLCDEVWNLRTFDKNQLVNAELFYLVMKAPFTVKLLVNVNNNINIDIKCDWLDLDNECVWINKIDGM